MRGEQQEAEAPLGEAPRALAADQAIVVDTGDRHGLAVGRAADLENLPEAGGGVAVDGDQRVGGVLDEHLQGADQPAEERLDFLPPTRLGSRRRPDAVVGVERRCSGKIALIDCVAPPCHQLLDGQNIVGAAHEHLQISRTASERYPGRAATALWQGGPMQVDGKVCVVTGGAAGIGRAMAERFLAAGARLVLGDIEGEALARTVEELGGEGAGVVGVVCDVRSSDQVDLLRDRALEAHGGVHVVCLNAGVAAIGPLMRTSLATWQWLVEVNLMGVVHGLHAFLPILVDQGEGHVVMTASVAGLISAPHLGAYAATKHAVVGLAATLRDELSGTGVGVSVVCPGMVNTRIFESERNRPAELAGETHTDPDATTAYRAVLAASAPPSAVAEAVLDAIVANRLFVLPSPELDGLVAARLEEVRGAMRR